MRIDKNKCAGCGKCATVCTLSRENVITRCRDEESGKIYYQINEKECVDCGVCRRESGCDTGALFMPDYGWPRIIRSQFSDPKVLHPKTNGGGRGTEEMKTNELTGKIKPGDVGIMIEMGRPNVGAWFTEIEYVSVELAKIGVEFEERNPTAFLYNDIKKGTFPPEILEQKVLSAIIEMRCSEENAHIVLNRIKELADEVDCCFSVGIISCFGDNYYFPGKDICKKANWEPYPNGKLNIGIGRIVEEALGKEY